MQKSSENVAKTENQETSIVKSLKQESKERIRAIKKCAKEEIAKEKSALLEKLASSEVRYQKKLQIKELRAKEALIPKRYSVGEEIFNSVSHGVGAGLSIAGLVLLILRTILYAPKDEIGFYLVGAILFGATLIVLYLMSTLYHALTPYHVKKVFGIFDHSSIYLLIAGTYTPFCLGVLRAFGGWWLFGIVWGLATLGITLYAIFGSKMRLASAITYVIMGWLIVLKWRTLQNVLPPLSVTLLLAGGAAYTIGVIFYALKKIKWTHSIWHLFVLAGSILHVFSVFFSLG